MRFAPFVLAALCVLVLFLGLDRIGVLDEREARDAVVAHELTHGADALTPRLDGEAFFEKPLGAYALDVWAHARPGETPLASRRLRAALAVLLVLVTGAAGARHFGARAGLFAAAALVTTVALPLAARGDGTQLLGTLLAWIGVTGLADVVFGRPGGRDLRLVVTWGALAAALLVAGPLTALWPLGGLALYVALARDRDDWRHARPWVGLVVLVVVALPWYGMMTLRHGAAFLARAPFFPYAAGAATPWFAGIVYAVPFLVVGCFPWTALLPDAMLHAATWWRHRLRRLGSATYGPDPAPARELERERHEEGAAHFLVACLLAALVPILVYPSPPLSAALPAAPAAALLCGRLLDHLFEEPTRLARALTRTTLTLAVVGSVTALMFVLLAGRVADAAPGLRALGAVTLLTSWAPFLADLVRRRRLAAVLLALPVALGTPIISLAVLPPMEDWLNARTAAETLAVVAPAGAPVLMVEPPPPSLRWYAARPLVLGAPTPTTLRAHRAGDGATYLAFRPAREHDVAGDLERPLEILARTPTLVVARVRPD